MLRAPEFTSLLGRSESSPEVAEFSRAYGPIEVDAPPGRKYLDAPARGISLLLEDGHVLAVQIRVRPSKGYAAFAGVLPFGLKQGMTQGDVHAVLGPPSRFDEFDSAYEADGGAARVTICYRDSVLKDVSIARPAARR